MQCAQEMATRCFQDVSHNDYCSTLHKASVAWSIFAPIPKIVLQKNDKSNVASAPLEATISHVRRREEVEVGEKLHVQ